MVSRFGELKDYTDYTRAAQEFDMRKKQAAMEMQLSQRKLDSPNIGGGSTPAALQLANEHQKAIQAGDMDRANAIEMFAKTRDKGLMLNQQGGLEAQAGYGAALGDIGYGKKFGEQSGAEQAKGLYTPAREEEIALRKAGVDLATKPLITGKIEAAKVAESNIGFAAREAEKKRAEAAYALPQIKEDATYMSDLLKDVKSHEGLAAGTGKSSYIPALYGSKKKSFNVLVDQVKGKQFMQAYQALKGGGVITEIEGEKATDALARMNTAQSEEDFIAAVDDFQEVVDRALLIAENEAQNINPMQASQNSIREREQQIGVNPYQRAEQEFNGRKNTGYKDKYGLE